MTDARQLTIGPQGRRTRVLHVVYAFSIGGLENVIVQLINHLPSDEFEHCILSLTTVGELRSRIVLPDVQFIALNKPPGHAFSLYPQIFKVLRTWRPDVIHTCNLAALEIAPLAWLARIPLRVHVEHGVEFRDARAAAKARLMRRFYRHFVSRQVAVSDALQAYLRDEVGVRPEHLQLIANGVDTDSFHPRMGGEALPDGCPFQPGQHWMLGTVGRLQPIKNQLSLARAFVRLLHDHPELEERARLVIVGEGEMRTAIEAELDRAEVRNLAWLPGARHDVAAILRALDCFILPSYSEGTSCTLQEAMACGLPVVATAVGGTPALVRDGETGILFQPDDDAALAAGLYRYIADPSAAADHGARARQRAEHEFGLEKLIAEYRSLFLGKKQ